MTRKTEGTWAHVHEPDGPRWTDVWYNDCGVMGAFIMLYTGHEDEYLISPPGAGIRYADGLNIGPFPTLKLAKIFYVLTYGGSL